MTHARFSLRRPDSICLALDRGSGPFDLDLSQLDFIDASGLRVLVQAYKYAERRGRVLGLVNVPARGPGP